MVDGCAFPASTYSKYPDRYPANAPRHADRASGAYVEANGRQYIDTTSALGAVILGHQNPDVDRAVVKQIQRGVSFSLPTRLEAELAERLCALVPNGERVRFAKNGYDVTTAAVRIARAVTGRPAVLMYEDGYHGMSDVFVREPKTGGVPRETRDLTVTCVRHDLPSIRQALNTHRPACLIVEAVLTSDPVEPPAGYFDALRQLCSAYGALLVLDEMVTGFRSGHPGAVATYGVQPDLVCYGKALANGWPLSALVGPREYMDRIDADVFMSTTFAGEAVSLAAALATLSVLETQGVAKRLAVAGRRLMNAYNAQAVECGLDTYFYGYPARPFMRWSDPRQRALFLETLIDNGVLCQGYFNLTLAMVGVMDRLATALAAAFDKVAYTQRVTA